MKAVVDTSPATAADPNKPDGGHPETPSLAEDLAALLDDGRTYVEAEITYQKTRAGFVAGRLRSGLIYGLAVLGMLHLALIGLVVGSILALMQLVSPWLATAIVVAVLLAAAALAGIKLRAHLGQIRSTLGAPEQ